MRRNFGAALTPTRLGANLLSALHARNKHAASSTDFILFGISEWPIPSRVSSNSSKDALGSQDSQSTIHVPENVRVAL